MYINVAANQPASASTPLVEANQQQPHPEVNMKNENTSSRPQAANSTPALNKAPHNRVNHARSNDMNPKEEDKVHDVTATSTMNNAPAAPAESASAPLPPEDLGPALCAIPRPAVGSMAPMETAGRTAVPTQEDTPTPFLHGTNNNIGEKDMNIVSLPVADPMDVRRPQPQPTTTRQFQLPDISSPVVKKAIRKIGVTRIMRWHVARYEVITAAEFLASILR